MAISNRAKSFAARVKKAEDVILDRVGRNDIQLVTEILSTDPMGRTTSIIQSTPVTIIGDIQPVTADDREILERGIAKIGDAKLFAERDINGNTLSIRPHDKILVDNEEWEIVTQAEEAKIGDELVHQSWIMRLRKRG